MLVTPLVLVLAASPDLRGARACMASAEAQKDACVDVVDGFVPQEARGEAHRRCTRAFRRALERCLVLHGIVVSEERQRLAQAAEDATDALSACFGRVEQDARACSARAATVTALVECRVPIARAMDECKATHAKREAQLEEERKALERAEAAATPPRTRSAGEGAGGGERGEKQDK